MIDVTRELQLLFPYFLFKYFIKPKEEIKKKKEKEKQILFFLAKNTEIRQISKLDFRINTYNKEEEEEGKKD